MEMFKVCERETKTKAYSKEGLAKAEKLDPKSVRAIHPAPPCPRFSAHAPARVARRPQNGRRGGG